MSDLFSHEIEEDASAAPEHGAEAGVYPTAGAAHEHGLVVLAMGSTYWVREDERGAGLMVEPELADDARHQLALFDRENAGWPPRAPAAPPRVSGAVVTPLIWMAAVVAMFWAQQRQPGIWEAAGALDPSAMFQRGEWWRPVSALFLHADVGHLVSNLGSGLFVFSSVLNTLRLARGWVVLFAASVTGNVMAALIYGTDGGYRSIGASTAVFAGIGILTGHALRRALGGAGQAFWSRSLFVPLAAGLILLGLLGGGGFRTDVVAHATGFAAGLVAGFGVGAREIKSAA